MLLLLFHVPDASALTSIAQLPTALRQQRRARTARHSTTNPLGPWRIERLLGEGALARAYAARHASSRAGAEASYAIKILRRKWQERPEGVALLRCEVVVASRVRHPNVISVLDARLDNPPYYLVMPRLIGSTLAARIASRGPILPAHALWIARQTAEALSAILTSCGMIHGDVKPENLHVSPTGRLTLLDLGFARGASEHLSATMPAALGTPAYAAPEALTNAMGADHRSDIHSLGIVLYEMLTGRRPFATSDPGRVVELARQGRAECLGVLRPELPRSLTSLVHRMISKEPTRRPQTYADLIEELIRLEIECFAAR